MLRQWHWLKADLTSGYGSEPAWTEEEERTIEGALELCRRGYHSSPSPWAGLEYAPGPVLCLVEVSEPVEEDETKSVSASRKLLKAINAERQLREFACDVAEEALDLEVQQGRTVDERSRAAIEVARRYARKQATPEELIASSAAAHAAWNDSAPSVSGSASAARNAAYANDAAAAWAAARVAASDASEAKFNVAMETLFEIVA